MSARKRNQIQESQNSINDIWDQDLKQSKEHRVSYTLETNTSQFRHVEPILDIPAPVPQKKKH